MQPQAADGRPVGIDGDEASSDVRQGGTRPVVAGTSRRDETDPDGLDDLVEERPWIAAAFFELVEDVHAGGRVTGQERRDEPVDRGGIGQAEQVADVGRADRVRRHRQELVQDRLGVAHPARRGTRDQGHRVGVDRAPVGFQDPVQLALDLGRRESADVVALEARQDRRPGSPRARSRRT